MTPASKVRFVEVFWFDEIIAWVGVQPDIVGVQKTFAGDAEQLRDAEEAHNELPTQLTLNVKKAQENSFAMRKTMMKFDHARRYKRGNMASILKYIQDASRCPVG